VFKFPRRCEHPATFSFSEDEVILTFDGYTSLYMYSNGRGTVFKGRTAGTDDPPGRRNEPVALAGRNHGQARCQ